MGYWKFNSGLLLVSLALGCSGETPEPRFTFVEEAEPVAAVILRDSTTITPLGYRVPVIHALLSGRATEAIARATLQHLIDSVASADTLAAGVRAVAFLMGNYDPQTGTAELEPVMSALWEPTDSVGITGSRRTARFRTNFRLLKPFPADQQESGGQ